MILTNSEKDFIKANISENVEKLLLSSKTKGLANAKFIVEQIKARQKIKTKLPTWHTNFDLIMPKSISVEQSSSEITAQYKSELFSGNIVLDLTGGFGVDFFAFCKPFQKAIYIEQNLELAAITQQNAKVLGLNNASFHTGNSIDFLRDYEGNFDIIYLDPARRDSLGGKVFSLEDCEPNILNIKLLLFEKTNTILLKCSPMLDISLAIKQLENVAEVHVISVENEVKELLFVLKKECVKVEFTKVVNFRKDKIDTLAFVDEMEASLNFNISKPLKYIYEPNAGLMKAGVFKSISAKFKLPKLHQNTHLYTSNELLEYFPGRIFEVKNILKIDKKEIKAKIPLMKANLAIRNFNDTVVNLKKKLGLVDGGNEYLFACTNNLNEKIILQTIKIN